MEDHRQQLRTTTEIPHRHEVTPSNARVSSRTHAAQLDGPSKIQGVQEKPEPTENYCQSQDEDEKFHGQRRLKRVSKSKKVPLVEPRSHRGPIQGIQRGLIHSWPKNSRKPETVFG
jgi:cytochrome oxidase assembly protein ShyY1